MKILGAGRARVVQWLQQHPNPPWTLVQFLAHVNFSPQLSLLYLFYTCLYNIHTYLQISLLDEIYHNKKFQMQFIENFCVYKCIKREFYLLFKFSKLLHQSISLFLPFIFLLLHNDIK